ncbi:MAG: ATP-dependent Clp protease ATP-binding subunit [Desulforudis sp.]|jgi:DNA polymerase III delta prime subunit|nr:MAG: ATP-dependent Clp protease ATP-binding subunit [Desulforudis sp.]
MINTETKECPVWIREMACFLRLKNLLILHGNVYDKVTFPITAEGETDWPEMEVPQFFEHFLKAMQYEVIGFYDLIDGLHFQDKEMDKLYKQVQSGKSLSSEKQKEGPSSDGTTKPSSATETSTEQKTASKGELDPIRVMEGVRKAMANTTTPCVFVFNLSSRLVTTPASLGVQEKNLFTLILKAVLGSASVNRGDRCWNNSLILICDKENDLPHFLYLNNPRCRFVHLPKPDSADRGRFIHHNWEGFYREPNAAAEPPSKDLCNLFSALTDGLTYYEMWGLVNLSRVEKQPLSNIRKILDRFKYGIIESEWDKMKDRFIGAEEKIRAKVIGQDNAVAAVLDTVKRAKIGLSAGASGVSSRPRGVLFFAGPTGVGKTEMAKAMASLIFGQEDRCIRFDMSEYSTEHSDQRLLGAPPGYVGYQAGGQLINAVRQNPFSILLFDEIEKAHQKIFDKFLQILDDGRLTGGDGETVYFSECIIIFTSNLGTVGRNSHAQIDSASQTEAMIHPGMSYPEIRKTILKRIHQHFNLELRRPEILNRFGDNFVVFDYIKSPYDEQILRLFLNNLTASLMDNKKIGLAIDESVVRNLLVLAQGHLQHGGRGIRNVVDSSLVNPLNRMMFDQGIEKEGNLRLKDLLDHGEDAPVRFVLDINWEPQTP